MLKGDEGCDDCDEDFTDRTVDGRERGLDGLKYTGR
jgi:hypothetical protein